MDQKLKITQFSDGIWHWSMYVPKLGGYPWLTDGIAYATEAEALTAAANVLRTRMVY